MKENIKKILFIISIFYSFIIVVLMLITSSNLVATIELHDSEENRTKLKGYKEQLSALEQNSCTETIAEIINHYEETSYDGEVSIRKMYEYDFDNSLLSYYTQVKQNCKLSEVEENKYNIATNFITSSIQRDELYQRYYFQYELGINDYMTRLIVEPSITSIEYQINRNIELEIISNLIEISSREVIINE
ncbi:MAG: hypothetical protein IJY25_06245 [Bacilli bacterium]|nr:hypothetical protein [Bacilli bacterium]